MQEDLVVSTDFSEDDTDVEFVIPLAGGGNKSEEDGHAVQYIVANLINSICEVSGRICQGYNLRMEDLR